jgi:hypothetical protein
MTDQDLPPCGDFFDALDLYRGGSIARPVTGLAYIETSSNQEG